MSTARASRCAGIIIRKCIFEIHASRYVHSDGISRHLSIYLSICLSLWLFAPGSWLWSRPALSLYISCIARSHGGSNEFLYILLARELGSGGGGLRDGLGGGFGLDGGGRIRDGRKYTDTVSGGHSGMRLTD